VMEPVVEKLGLPSNFNVAPAAKTSPLGLSTLMVNMANGDVVVCPGASGRALPLIVMVIVAVLVVGAVNPKVAGWKVMLLPAVVVPATMVAVPVTPALAPDPTKVTPTAPVVTVMVTLPHFTISWVLAGTDRIEAPPQTLIVAGPSPPAELVLISIPAPMLASFTVNWQGFEGTP